ncbi:uncharacterized protein AB675_7560 [Cyphellophora attinorum]|uniref:Uncharacterized protein n=1 Tax=Cyphellophora attinorum TaxID=1664694 RepID=A0A0N0NMP8_9EURO|nr:uncharacterized protein AB675_7560 [Phialophora attinorum]KPI40459.1 hypothetical protein AB675_7560 [Phialophora attinorum]
MARNRSGLDAASPNAHRKTSATKTTEPIRLTAPSTNLPTPVLLADSTTYTTHVRVFIQSTGDDSGSECELTGWISFPGTGLILNYNVDLPIITNFSAENNGLGRLIAEYTGQQAGSPAPFQAFCDEDDVGGLDHIMGVVMDWTRPENKGFADGGVWEWRGWRNSEDNRYIANLWWQVSPGWV